MKVLLPPALDIAGIPTPPAVTEALDLRKAAEEIVERLRTAPAPNLDDATAATAEALIGAIAEQELLAPVRTRHAAALAENARSRIAQAWESAAQELRPRLAKAFNAAAKSFTTEASKLPGLDPQTIGYQRSNPLYRELFAAADKLTALAGVRDGLGARTYERAAGLHSDTFEAMTRYLSYTHMQDVQNTARMNAGRDTAFWLQIAQHPRITIHWNERPDQLDQLARISYGDPAA